jgi:hypothetical protein
MYKQNLVTNTTATAAASYIFNWNSATATAIQNLVISLFCEKKNGFLLTSLKEN